MKNNFFEKLKKWSYENGADFDITTYGDNYFNDNFRVQAATITIDYYNRDYYTAAAAAQEIKKKISRNKNHVIGYQGGSYCYYFVIFEKSDFIALEEHGNRTKTANDNFNEWYHDLVTKYGAHNVSA